VNLALANLERIRIEIGAWRERKSNRRFARIASDEFC